MGDAEIADEGAIRSGFVIFGERKGIASFPWVVSSAAIFHELAKGAREENGSKFKVPGTRFGIAVRTGGLAGGADGTYTTYRTYRAEGNRREPGP